VSSVLHLMPTAAWLALAGDEPVTNDSLGTHGFIHCTDTLDVMLRVANAFYADQPGDFVVLHIDVERLTSPCVWEEPAHISDAGEAFAPSFPHVYGPLDRDAVAGIQPLLRDDGGRFVGYGELSTI
jgi:uncharacterized protein (DUF952 family)